MTDGARARSAQEGRGPDERTLLRFPVVEARPGRTRRNLPAEEWKARIVEAARLLFVERGYDGVSMEEVARTVGISRARLYHLFPGRRELFDAIIAQDAQSLAGELLLELTRAPDARAKVYALVDVFFRYVQSRQERHRVLYSDASQSAPGLAELMRTVRGALAETLSQQLAAVDPVPPHPASAEKRMMAHAVIALAEGAATAWASGSQLDRERSVTIVGEVALRALRLGSDSAGM